MRNGDPVVPLSVAQLLEPPVTQPSGRHLNRFAVLLRLGFGVEPFDVQRNTVLATIGLDQPLVAIGLRPAQSEIAMSRPDSSRIGPPHQVEQAHRIDPPAHGNQDTFSGTDQPPIRHVFAKFLVHHSFMICFSAVRLFVSLLFEGPATEKRANRLAFAGPTLSGRI